MPAQEKSLTHRVFVNTGFQIIGKVASVALSLFAIGMMTRYLDPAGFGVYTTITVYVGFLAMLADFGLYSVMTRELGLMKHAPEKVLASSIVIRLALLLGILFLGSLIVLFLPYSLTIRQGVWLLVAGQITISIVQLMLGVYHRYMRSWIFSLSEVFARGILLLMTFVFISKGLSILWFVGLLSFVNILNFFLVYFYSRRLLVADWKLDWRLIQHLWRETLPLGISIIFSLIYVKSDTILLSLWKPAHDVGLYGVAYKILEVLQTLPVLFLGPLIPILSLHAEDNTAQFKNVFQKAFDALIIAGVPLFVGGLFFARPVIMIIAGSEFSDATNALKILMGATAILFISSLFANAIIVLRQQWKMVRVYIVGAIGGLILYMVLIPRFSIIGAAIGTVLIESFILVSAVVVLRKKVDFLPGLTIAWKSIVSVSIASLIAFLSSVFLLPWFISAILFVVTYVFSLFLTRALTIDLLFSLLSGRRLSGATPDPSLHTGD